MKDTILSILRHALTFGGGILVAKGIVTDAASADIIGALCTLVGVAWGAIDEYLATKKAKEYAAAGI